MKIRNINNEIKRGINKTRFEVKCKVKLILFTKINILFTLYNQKS